MLQLFPKKQNVYVVHKWWVTKFHKCNCLKYCQSVQINSRCRSKVGKAHTLVGNICLKPPWLCCSCSLLLFCEDWIYIFKKIKIFVSVYVYDDLRWVSAVQGKFTLFGGARLFFFLAVLVLISYKFLWVRKAYLLHNVPGRLNNPRLKRLLNLGFTVHSLLVQSSKLRSYFCCSCIFWCCRRVG